MKEEQPFRFLSDLEFMALPVRDRVVYLSSASQELEQRQKLLREQIKRMGEATEKAS